MDNIKKINSNTRLVISKKVTMYGIRSKGVRIIKTDDSGNEVDIWLTSEEIKDIAKEYV